MVRLPSLQGRAYEYCSVADLSRDTAAFAARLPNDVSLIVGVPRSGLLAANLLALHAHLPMTDIAGYIDGRILDAGTRLSKQDALPIKGRAMILDDSVMSGGALARVRDRLAAAGLLSNDLLFSTIYVTSEKVNAVDMYQRIVPTPRIFEWHLFNHRHLQDSCVMLEGVLCRPPERNEAENEIVYSDYIRSVPPLVRTKREIGCILSTRPEQYRRVTEEWLDQHQINYRKLVLLSAGGNMSLQEKGKLYRSDEYCLFVEYAEADAIRLAHLTGKSVYCAAHRRMIRPSEIDLTRWGLYSFVRRAARRVIRARRR